MRYLYLLLPLALAGCATTDQSDGRVAVITAANGQEFGGANCTVMTAANSFNVVTPASLVLPATGDLRVVCNRPGYRTSEVILPPIGYGGSSGSGVGVGLGGGSGGVGMGLGFSFPLSGGNSGARYPARVVVNMNPL